MKAPQFLHCSKMLAAILPWFVLIHNGIGCINQGYSLWKNISPEFQHLSEQSEDVIVH
jgi:hypothetical protein